MGLLLFEHNLQVHPDWYKGQMMLNGWSWAEEAMDYEDETMAKVDWSSHVLEAAVISRSVVSTTSVMCLVTRILCNITQLWSHEACSSPQGQMHYSNLSMTSFGVPCLVMFSTSGMSIPSNPGHPYRCQSRI